jgi:hypothetical protein
MRVERSDFRVNLKPEYDAMRRHPIVDDRHLFFARARAQPVGRFVEAHTIGVYDWRHKYD